MNVFVVYPDTRAGWALLREGESAPLHFGAKQEAIGYARCLAAANGPSAVKVETAFGQFETGWEYDDAGAPRPLRPRRA
ncbi:MAG: DUF2188 domain-containing protein [Burkholderiales bacterium]